MEIVIVNVIISLVHIKSFLSSRRRLQISLITKTNINNEAKYSN